MGEKNYSEIFHTNLEISPMMDQKTTVSTISQLRYPWASHGLHRPQLTDPLPDPLP